MVLIAHLLGTPSICVDKCDIKLPYKKATAVLYYLLIKRKASRSELASLLWADTDDATALKNLRHAIYSIRKALGINPFIDGRTTIAFDSNIEIHCDVDAFLKRGILDIFRGEFLKDFSVPTATAFEEWLSTERNVLQTQYLQCLLGAEREAFYNKNFDLAEQHGLRYISTDPFEESAYHILMQIYSIQKKYRKAISLYQALRKHLSDEFGISPSKEISTLYYDIVNNWNNSTNQVEEEEKNKLLGKEITLGKLLALCNKFNNSNSQSGCLIQGQAGVGKSYLLNYMLQQYDFSGWFVCRGACYQSEMNTTLAPWSAIMLSLVAELTLHNIQLPEFYLKNAARLFSCLAVEQPDNYLNASDSGPIEAGFQSSQDSALLIFSLVAKKMPLLIIFEDIHWMDSTSAQMLSLLLKRLGGMDIKVICTSRDVIPPYVQEMVDSLQKDKLLDKNIIYPFTREECHFFVQYYLPQEYSQELLDQIFYTTQGNALLITQLLNSMKENPNIQPSVQDPESIIAFRLLDITMEERQVLDAISVFPDWAPFEIISSVLTQDTLVLTCICEQLCQKVLLVESVRDNALGYCFAHERIKSILSQKQSESRLRILHLRVAQYLESLEEDDQMHSYKQIIYHYEIGGDKLKAFRYKVLMLTVFAGRCYELLPILYANSEITELDKHGMTGYFKGLQKELTLLRKTRFGDELQQLEKLERDILHAQSRHYIYNANYPEGIEVLQQLLASATAAEDYQMISNAHIQYIYYAIQTYNRPLMKRHLEEGMKLKEKLATTPDWAFYLRLYGLYQLVEGNYQSCRNWLQQSVEIFEALDPKDSDKYTINIAGAYNYIGESYRLQKDFKTAFIYYEKSITYSKKRSQYQGSANFYTNYGVAAFQSGDFKKARALFEYAQNIYISFYEFSQYPIALSYLAYFAATDGNYNDAQLHIAKALELAMRFGSPWWAGITAFMLWKIRILLEEAQQVNPQISALYPHSKREHCLWVLSFLEKLEPCIEAVEIAKELKKLN